MKKETWNFSTFGGTGIKNVQGEIVYLLADCLVSPPS